MASRRHQFILGLVVRSMRAFGARIHSVHGDYDGKLGAVLPMPPQIARHKPDTVGLTPGGTLCIGDAKTESDVASRRTIEQIADFCGFTFQDEPCEVFIGIPSSVEGKLNGVLRRHGLHTHPRLHLVLVPDEIIDG